MRSVLRSSNVLTIAGHLLITIAIQKYFQHQGENRNCLKGAGNVSFSSATVLQDSRIHGITTCTNREVINESNFLPSPLGDVIARSCGKNFR